MKFLLLLLLICTLPAKEKRIVQFIVNATGPSPKIPGWTEIPGRWGYYEQENTKFVQQYEDDPLTKISKQANKCNQSFKKSINIKDLKIEDLATVLAGSLTYYDSEPPFNKEYKNKFIIDGIHFPSGYRLINKEAEFPEAEKEMRKLPNSNNTFIFLSNQEVKYVRGKVVFPDLCKSIFLHNPFADGLYEKILKAGMANLRRREVIREYDSLKIKKEVK